MSYYTKYVDKVKLKDTWEIVTRGLKWSELTQSQKNLFGKGMSTFNQQTVFKEWKNGLSESDKNKAQDLQDDYLSKYDIKNWSNVSDRDREKFFDNKKSNYIDWYNENYAERDRIQKGIRENTPSKPEPEPQVQAPRPTGIGPASQPSTLKIDPKPQVQTSTPEPQVQAPAPSGIGPASKPTMMLPDGNAVTGSYDEIAKAAGDDVPKSFLLNFQWSDLSPAQQAKFENKETFSERRAEKGFKSSPEDIFSKKLDAAGLDAALEEYSASQLLKYYNDGDLKIGKNALNDIKKRADDEADKVQIGGLNRIGESRQNPSKDSAQAPGSDTGIYYKTYDSGGSSNILKIGNLPKHRYEGSPYASIKIVDYDASVSNYDPTREGSSTSSFVTDYKKHSGKVKFKDFEVKKLSGTEMSKIRTKERVEDYKQRGLIKAGDGARITESSTVKTYKTMKDGKVSYVPLKTDDRGNLKQLSFDGSVSTAKFPKELSDADSYSAGIGKEASFFDKVNTKASARNSMATIASTKSRGRALLQGIANN